MKANELRIGNLVWEDYSGEMIVFGLVTGGINPRVELRKSERLPTGSYHIDTLKGIPLTPEWLERFGFRVEDGHDNFSYPEENGSVYYLSYNDKRSEVHAVSVCHPMIDDSHTAFAWHVKYVHQLQNIFYCILGKELELKQ